jgi:chromosome partitioning protein
MSHIISVVNQKGGVGKTTTAVNLSTYLSYLGKSVLLVDVDPQANATSGLGINHRTLDKSIYQVLLGRLPLREVMIGGDLKNHKLVPASPALAGANIDLVGDPEREFKLYNLLQPVKDDFDFVIVDCPPSLDLLTINGIVAADKILIPVQAEYYALEGLGQLLETINLVKENLRPNLEILGAVMTMYDKRNLLSQQVMDELYRYFPAKIFRVVIPRNVRLTEAPSHGKSILHYDKNSKGAKSYERLAREILEHLSSA